MRKVIVRTPIGAGGSGSGNWKHNGRPGQRGGSGKGGSFQVGITSARPGKPTTQVEAEMEDFKGMMAATPVTNLSVHLGLGGWEGGSEATYVTQYDGNGEGVKALARFAQKYDQDAVLIQRYTSPRNPKAQPQNRIVFDKDLNEDSVRAIESAAVEAGFGGWTWGKSDGKPLLMLTCVPQWGGDAAAHRRSFSEFSSGLKAAGKSFTETEKAVVVSIMERGDYDKIIAGND